LASCAAVTGVRFSMNTEARARFLAFATSADATWPGNFRDLNGALLRMATLAAGGRITIDVVDDEIRRLRAGWRSIAGGESPDVMLESTLPAESLDTIDPFDRVQLSEVIRVCRASQTLSDAGRRLFAASRSRKAAPNDADRLRKYLARFGLDWKGLRAEAAVSWPPR
jgi:transcriptional regulatory protein RtcR